VMKLLKILGAEPLHDQAGLFVWAVVPGNYATGFEMSDTILHAANVFITPGGIFGEQGNGYIRVSLCSTVEKLQEAIDRIIISQKTGVAI
jgi:LL-diaminopimelate aminotransferase